MFTFALILINVHEKHCQFLYVIYKKSNYFFWHKLIKNGQIRIQSIVFVVIDNIFLTTNSRFSYLQF